MSLFRWPQPAWQQGDFCVVPGGTHGTSLETGIPGVSDCGSSRLCALWPASVMGRIGPKSPWHPYAEKDQKLSRTAFNEDAVLWFNTPVLQSMGSNYHVHQALVPTPGPHRGCGSALGGVRSWHPAGLREAELLCSVREKTLRLRRGMRATGP